MIDYNKNIKINDLINEDYNYYTKTIVGMIEFFMTKENKNNFLNYREKHLFIKNHRDFYVLSEKINRIVLDEGDEQINYDLFYNNIKVFRDELLLRKHFYETEKGKGQNASIMCSLPKYKIDLEYAGNNLGVYNFGNFEINTTKNLVCKYYTSFIMPFTMLHSYDSDKKIEDFLMENDFLEVPGEKFDKEKFRESFER